MLVSAVSAFFRINALNNIALHAFLSAGPTPAKAQEQQIVLGSVAQAQLLAGRGDPTQLEFIATADFDQVKVEFGSVANSAQRLIYGVRW